MNQPSWTFLFKDDPLDAAAQATLLKDLLLDATPDIEVAERSGNRYTQGGWPELIVTIVGSTGLAGILKALAVFRRSGRIENLEIIRKDGVKETTLKVNNISSKNFEDTLKEFMDGGQNIK